jgi:hypothetical protein
MEGVTLIHLSTTLVVVHVGAIYVVTHDIVGIISEQQMIWTLEYRAVAYFVATRFCIFIIASGVQALDFCSLILLNPLRRALVGITCCHRITTKISVSIVALPIGTLFTLRVLLDDEVSRACVGAA